MSESVKLQVLAANFKALLEKYASENDSDAERLLGWLTPLFDDIAAGNVSHRKYKFRSALGREPDFYYRHMDVLHAEAEFSSELEGRIR